MCAYTLPAVTDTIADTMFSPITPLICHIKQHSVLKYTTLIQTPSSFSHHIITHIDSRRINETTKQNTTSTTSANLFNFKLNTYLVYNLHVALISQRDTVGMGWDGGGSGDVGTRKYVKSGGLGDRN